MKQLKFGEAYCNDCHKTQDLGIGVRIFKGECNYFFCSWTCASNWCSFMDSFLPQADEDNPSSNTGVANAKSVQE